MTRRRFRVFVVAVAALAVAGVALAAAFMTTSSTSKAQRPAKFAVDRDASSQTRFGGGNEAISLKNITYDDYRSALRAYPADFANPNWVQNAKATFDRIAARSTRKPAAAEGPPKTAPNPGILNVWQQYGPQQQAIEPGVLNFFGAEDATAGRTASLAISPACNASQCRMWAGPVGGGIWRTDNALDSAPSWQYISSPFAQNSIGTIMLDPNDITGNRLYVGTGEPNRCGSGCEAGVGIYRSDNGGNSWVQLPASCASNATYACAFPGQDAFLGRAVARIEIDPTNPSHILVSSSRARRGISSIIGLTGTQPSTEPANAWGVYESTDGGATFTEIWSAGPFGAIDLGLDPIDPRVVYASGFDAGVVRRCPVGGSPACGGEAGTGQTDFQQVFNTEHNFGTLTGRTMFELVKLSGPLAKTRIYLTDGGQGDGPPAAFWRTDNANQTAAALLATEGAGATAPAGNGNPYPTTYNGWQKLTSASVASPYYATQNFCTGQCWYDQDVYSPKSPQLGTSAPDTVYVLGSYSYGEIPCYTKGVGCGSGISNGRGVLLSTTAGDPDPGNGSRTFTDMQADAQNVAANYCALPGFSSCLVAHHSIHPDQHEIVTDPRNPLSFWEGSDGGIAHNVNGFTNLSRACSFRGLSAANLPQCQKLLSRIPNTLIKDNTNGYGSTLQFIGGGFNPNQPCDYIVGTQDNGTWRPQGTCDSQTWKQQIYGDGGNAGFDAKNGNWMFNEFTAGFADANFKNGEPTKWVIITGDIAASTEQPFIAFYWPQIQDPNPPLYNGQQTHPIFSGARHVWRSWAFGAGNPQTVPQQTTPDIAFYEANCPEFTTSGADPTCGDFQPLGGAAGLNTAGDLAGTAYGSDRTGGAVSYLARSKADNQTMWAATSAGRVFVTYNANATDPATVVWYRLDNMAGATASPSRPPVGIYVSPLTPNRAYLAYSGFNAATPTTPGHVFQVDVTTAAGVPTNATFTNLNVEGANLLPSPSGNADLPANDVIRDDATGNLYVATDFGVLKGTPQASPPSPPNTYSWSTTAGMPKFEVTHLTPVLGTRDSCVANCAHALYAVTHSQGMWVMSLG